MTSTENKTTLADVVANNITTDDLKCFIKHYLKEYELTCFPELFYNINSEEYLKLALEELRINAV